MLEQNPKYLDDLQKYKVPEFESRYGLNMKFDDEKTATKVLSELSLHVKENGKNFDEIFTFLDENNYAKYVSKTSSTVHKQGYYLQFLNYNYATKDEKLLFTKIIVFNAKYETVTFN
ncbi:MAG: hypothetical protein ACK5LP_08185 [Campylobacteraceae bacterium]